MRRFVFVAFFMFVEVGSLSSQDPAYVIYRLPEPDTMFHAFGGRQCAIVHFAMPDSLASNRVVNLTAPLPLVAQFGAQTAHSMPVPERLARDHERVNNAYDSRDYEEAARQATALVMEDPENPFFVDSYARVLFRMSERRQTARDVYMRLVQLLDSQVFLGDSVVPVDVHFLEAYGKLAALHLDAEDYESSAFEATRALIGAYHHPGQEMWQLVDLQMSNLTEAYAELGQVDLARWFGAGALRWNPMNQTVLPYLRRVGPKPERIVACAGAQGESPAVGNHSLALEQDGGDGLLHCHAPDVDRDGTIGPCLRIGEVFVGVSELETRSSIGHPADSVTMDDGTQAFLHPLFNDFSTGQGAYYVVQYEEVDGERVVSSVQLTGQTPPVTYSCSCIELGSTPDAVERQFGNPSSVDEFEVQGSSLKGVLWSYDPYPISVEIVNGVVHSIKMWRPEDIPPQRRRPSLFYSR